MASEKLMLLVIAGFVCILILAKFAVFYRSFKKELDYINTEINRTVGGEQERWKRARKRLFLSLIPFYKPKRKKSHH